MTARVPLKDRCLISYKMRVTGWRHAIYWFLFVFGHAIFIWRTNRHHARNAHHQQDDELMLRHLPASVQARTNVSQHIHTRIHRQVVPGQAATQSRPCKSVLSPGAYPPSAAPAGQTADALQTAENASDPCRIGPCTCWPEMASVTRVRTC